MTQMKIRDARTQRRFFVDNVIIRGYGPEIGVYGIAVYSALCLHADINTQTCFPSHKTIAKEIDCSERKVCESLAQLERLMLITVTHREGTSNLYTLLDPPALRGPTPCTTDTHQGYPAVHSNNPHDEQSSLKIAEAAISPPDDSLWPDNSNFSPREETTEEKPIPTTTDPLALAAECASRTKGKKSWTVTADAGGADPYQDGPLKAACAILCIDPDSLAEEEKRTWARQLRRITKAVKGGTPRLFVEACQAWASAYEWKGKSGAPYSNVFRGSFPDDMQMLMRQVRSGTAPTAEVRISN